MKPKPMRRLVVAATMTAAVFIAGCSSAGGEGGPLSYDDPPVGTSSVVHPSSSAGSSDTGASASMSAPIPDSSGTDSSGAVSMDRGGSKAEPVSDVSAALPLTWSQSDLVAPGWTSLPLEHDGIFLGFQAPSDEHETLRFRAMSDGGRVLWQQDRPASCTGFALSRAGDDAIAVLTDVDTSDGQMRVTATGYNLASGEQRWGPVPVPGSLQGPGLVFAPSAPASAMGDAGARAALNPATGEIVVDEATSDGLAVIGEYDGTIVTADDAQLYGVTAATGLDFWHTGNRAGLDAIALAGVDAPRGTALIASAVGEPARLIDMSNGATLGERVRGAVYDALARSYVMIGQDSLAGIPGTGDPWVADVPAGSLIAAAGSGLVYIVGDGVGRIFNTLTGYAAGNYAPEVTSRFAVPQLISDTGAAVFTIDGRVVFATATAG